MDSLDRHLPTVDEQLGSPAFSFELSWLTGVIIGTLVILAAARRRSRGDRVR